MLRFGVSCDFRNAKPWDQPYPDFYSERLEFIRYLDSLGFDSVWLTEHHFVDDGYLPAPLSMSAAIAATTSNIYISQGVLLLPFYHPVRLAEEAAVIDNLSGGRFMLGIGSGYRVEEFEGYGIPRNHRRSLMDEGLEILKRCWTEESFSFEGKRYSLRNVAVYPKPFQRPHPPIWIGSRSDAATERAARFGCHLIPQRGRKQHALYVSSLQQHGYDPADFRISRTLHCVATYDDPDDVWAELSFIADQEQYRFGLYHNWLATAADAEADRALATQAPVRVRPFIGTPVQIGERVSDLQRETSATDITLVIVPMGKIPERLYESARLLADEVFPVLRGDIEDA